METNPEIIKKVEDWAKNHPNPNEPLIASGFNSYSPNRLVEEVKNESKFGKRMYIFLEEGYKKTSSLDFIK